MRRRRDDDDDDDEDHHHHHPRGGAAFCKGPSTLQPAARLIARSSMHYVEKETEEKAVKNLHTHTHTHTIATGVRKLLG